MKFGILIISFVVINATPFLFLPYFLYQIREDNKKSGASSKKNRLSCQFSLNITNVDFKLIYEPDTVNKYDLNLKKKRRKIKKEFAIRFKPEESYKKEEEKKKKNYAI